MQDVDFQWAKLVIYQQPPYHWLVYNEGGAAIGHICRVPGEAEIVYQGRNDDLDITTLHRRDPVFAANDLSIILEKYGSAIREAREAEGEVRSAADDIENKIEDLRDELKSMDDPANLTWLADSIYGRAKDLEGYASTAEKARQRIAR